MPWVPGFVDYHTHLVRIAAGGMPSFAAVDVRGFHEGLAAEGTTPMDGVSEPVATDGLAERVAAALARARARGLVEIWEAGLDEPACLRALFALREANALDVRVRVLMASGVAERGGMPARTGDALIDVVGVKFYADGWLGPRTCAVSHGFEDGAGRGILFLDADTLARRLAPFAEGGWIIATHAIGDQAIESVLDAYGKVYGSDTRAAGARIEHAQILRPDLVARIAEMGVRLCIQPLFARSDAEHVERALGTRWPMAYAWRTALDAGCDLVSGSDFPIEPLNGVEPLLALADQLGEGGLDLALRVSASAAAGRTQLSSPLGGEEVPSVLDVEVAGA